MMKSTAKLVFPKRTRTLAQLLTSCSHVANTLNWNQQQQQSSAGRLLAVRLQGRQVDLALTAHPRGRSSWDGSTSVTIPLAQSKQYLQDLLNNNNGNTKRGGGTTNIQGLIIAWPRQPDGWLGYQCGKVFYHLLDAIETTARPAVCLYDLKSVDHAAAIGDDVWGRNPIYGRLTAAAVSNRPHIASREQYYYPPAAGPVMRAVDLAEQFCQEHWPEYYQNDDHDQGELVMDDGPLSHHHPNTASMWAASSSFHGSLLPRSAPVMMQYQQQHSWMSSGDHHQSAGGMRQRSLASA